MASCDSVLEHILYNSPTSFASWACSLSRSRVADPAFGANLPAFLVIIKSTMMYEGGGKSWKEYPQGQSVRPSAAPVCLSPGSTLRKTLICRWEVLNLPHVPRCFNLQRFFLSPASVQQMAGRAGRAGFDTLGKVIVLTQQDAAQERKYRDIFSGNQTMIESQLHKCLVEHLNSEIVLKTIRDLPSVLDWASSTFLWVRGPSARLTRNAL